METGKIVAMIGFLILGIVSGSTIGYNIGHASGVLETTTKMSEEQLAAQEAAANQVASPYSSVPSNPVEDVQTNPFN